jgi:hypothetical protein
MNGTYNFIVCYCVTGVGSSEAQGRAKTVEIKTELRQLRDIYQKQGTWPWAC